jgi:hypothetical protein
MKFAVENRRTRGKTGHSATLSTTNPTWIDPGSNPDLRGERPATNRLSRDTAFTAVLMKTKFSWYVKSCLLADNRRRFQAVCSQNSLKYSLR